jgi:hypothetical protein
VTEPSLWFVISSVADLFVVTYVVLIESLGWLLRARLYQAARKLDGLGDERYLNRFAVPVAALVASVPISIGVNLITNDLGGLSHLAGLLLICATVMVAGSGFVAAATGQIVGRPPRLRIVRRELAVAAERMSSCSHPRTCAWEDPVELTRLRRRLVVLQKTGERLAASAARRRWRAGPWAEPRWQWGLS